MKNLKELKNSKVVSLQMWKEIVLSKELKTIERFIKKDFSSESLEDLFKKSDSMINQLQSCNEVTPSLSQVCQELLQELNSRLEEEAKELAISLKILRMRLKKKITSKEASDPVITS